MTEGSDGKSLPSIDDAKENVQPLTDAADAITRAQAERDRVKRRNGERIKLEHILALKKEKGQYKPYMAAWRKYIKWARDNYENESSDVVTRILWDCACEFVGVPEAQNDPHYLAIWIDYAARQDNTTTGRILDFLKQHEIGQKCAMFYESLSSWHEKNDRMNEAKQAFLDGISKKAMPLDKLERHYHEFEKRCKEKSKELRRQLSEFGPTTPSNGSSSSIPQPTEGRRQALGVLSASSTSDTDGNTSTTTSGLKRGTGVVVQPVQVLPGNCKPDDPLMTLAPKRPHSDENEGCSGSLAMATPARNTMGSTVWSTAGFGIKTPASDKRGYAAMGRPASSARASKSPWPSTGKKSNNTSISIFVDKEFDDKRNSLGEPIMYNRAQLEQNHEELQFEEARMLYAERITAKLKKQTEGSSNKELPIQPLVTSITDTKPPLEKDDEKENLATITDENAAQRTFAELHEDAISSEISASNDILTNSARKSPVFALIIGDGPIKQEEVSPSSFQPDPLSQTTSATETSSETTSASAEPCSLTVTNSSVPTEIPESVLALSPFSQEFKAGVIKARAVKNWSEYIQTLFRGIYCAELPEVSVTARISVADESNESKTFMSLANILDLYIAEKKKMEENLAVYYAIEVLECAYICSKASVVHGSITPASFVLRYGKEEEEWPTWEPSSDACEHNSSWVTRGLTLNGFNDTTTIDASFVHPEQCLHRELPSFLSMIPNPQYLLWATDCLSIASVLHHIVFDNSPLEVKTDSKQHICLTKKIRVTWRSRSLWNELFDTLLNWHDDEKDILNVKPPYSDLRKKFEKFLTDDKKRLQSLTMLLLRQQIMQQDAVA